MMPVKHEVVEQQAKRPKKRKCVVEDVILRNKSRIEPIFGEFANGRPLPHAALTATMHHNVSQDGRRRRRRVMTVETPGLDYAGTNFGKDSKAGTTTTVFLGVLDKTTGKMKLVETSGYCLRPVIPSAAKLVPAKNPINLHKEKTTTYLDKQETVAHRFGSKKARQAVNRKKQYQVDAENMTEAIDQAVAGTAKVENPGSWSGGRENALISLLPPCNREADRIQDVYRLEDLAPDDFLMHLMEDAQVFLEKRYPDDPSYSLLAIDLLSSCKLEPEGENQMRLCCLALYIHHLLCFLRLKGRELSHKDAMKDCPAPIRRHLYQEYTQGGTFKIRSNESEDRIICMTLILAFISNKYELPSGLLLQSLPLTRDRLNLIMKLIGASYRLSNHDYILRVPLTKVPQQMTGLKSNKKKKGRA